MAWNGVWVENSTPEDASVAIAMTPNTHSQQQQEHTGTQQWQSKHKMRKMKPKKREKKKMKWKHINKTCVINFKWTCQRIYKIIQIHLCRDSCEKQYTEKNQPNQTKQKEEPKVSMNTKIISQNSNQNGTSKWK